MDTKEKNRITMRLDMAVESGEGMPTAINYLTQRMYSKDNREPGSQSFDLEKTTKEKAVAIDMDGYYGEMGVLLCMQNQTGMRINRIPSEEEQTKLGMADAIILNADGVELFRVRPKMTAIVEPVNIVGLKVYAPNSPVRLRITYIAQK